MSLFESLVAAAVNNSVGLNPLTMVVEKELLHHDVLREMSGAGLLERLTFMGGTCLRACYGSQRLSEDLDFTGGSDFQRELLLDMPLVLTETLHRKYGLKVDVSEPRRESGNVDTWKLKIITRPEQKGVPVQRINIDICAIPSYDKKPMMLHNFYGVDMGTSGLIIQVESREEILADKLIALSLRSGRIKNRDLWDIVWLKQQGIILPIELLKKKVYDHNQTIQSYLELLTKRCEMVTGDSAVQHDFKEEMKRFLPIHIVKETIENSAFWDYLQNAVFQECKQVEGMLTGRISAAPFKM